MPRKDRQHKEYRVDVLGTRVYCGTEKGDAHYWEDMALATGRVLHKHGARRDAGRSTGILWLARWALDNMPEPIRGMIATMYLEIRADEAVRRTRTDDPEAPQLPPFGHTPAT